MPNAIQRLAQRWISTTGDDPAARTRRDCGTHLLATETSLLDRLWRQTIAAHQAHAMAGGALSYLDGLRAGLANATATMTGLSRNQVAARLTDIRPELPTGTDPTKSA